MLARYRRQVSTTASTSSSSTSLDYSSRRRHGGDKTAQNGILPQANRVAQPKLTVNGRGGGTAPLITADEVELKTRSPVFKQMHSDLRSNAKKANAPGGFSVSKGPNVRWHTAIYENYPPEVQCFLTPVPYMDRVGQDMTLELSPEVSRILSNEASSILRLKQQPPQSPLLMSTFERDATLALESICQRIMDSTNNLNGSLYAHYEHLSSNGLTATSPAVLPINIIPSSVKQNEAWFQDALKVDAMFADAMRASTFYRLVPQCIKSPNTNAYNIVQTKRDNLLRAYTKIGRPITKSLRNMIDRVALQQALLDSPTVFIQIYEYTMPVEQAAVNYVDREGLLEISSSTLSPFVFENNTRVRKYALGYLVKQQVMAPPITGFHERKQLERYDQNRSAYRFTYSMPELVRLPILFDTTSGSSPNQQNIKVIDYSSIIARVMTHVEESIASITAPLATSPFQRTNLSTTHNNRRIHNQRRKQVQQQHQQQQQRLARVRTAFKKKLQAQTSIIFDRDRIGVADALRHWFVMPQVGQQSNWRQLLSHITSLNWFTQYTYLSYFGLELPDEMFDWGNMNLLGKGSFGYVQKIKLNNPIILESSSHKRTNFVGGVLANIVLNRGGIALLSPKDPNQKQQQEVQVFHSYDSPALREYESRVTSQSQKIYSAIKSDQLSWAANNGGAVTVPGSNGNITSGGNTNGTQERKIYASPVDFDANDEMAITHPTPQRFAKQVDEVVIALKLLGGLSDSKGSLNLYRTEVMFSLMMTVLGGGKKHINPCHGICVKDIYFGLIMRLMPYGVDTLQRYQANRKLITQGIKGDFPIFDFPMDGIAPRMLHNVVSVSHSGAFSDTTAKNTNALLRELQDQRRQEEAALGIPLDRQPWRRVTPSNLMSIQIPLFALLQNQLTYQTLKDNFKNAPANPMGAMDVVKLGIGMSDGLDAMHQEGLAHRDFKPANALADHDMYGCLTDLGFAVPLGEFHNISGSMYYLPPAESAALGGKGSPIFNHKTGFIDVYAFGRTLLDLMETTIEYDSSTAASVVYGFSPKAIELAPRICALGLWCMALRPTWQWDSTMDIKLLGTPSEVPSAGVARDVLSEIWNQYGGEEVRLKAANRIAKIMYMR